MKTALLILTCLLLQTAAFACDACRQQQPAFLRKIAHGTGPDSNWDYLIVAIAALLVMVTLYYSVKWLIRPGEKAPDHIKQLVITQP